MAYDVVLYGASGFTGRLVAEHLKNVYPSGLRWAMAGRSADKLKAVRDELGIDDAVAIEVADSNDSDALATLTAKTKVVCTTVGPYAKYGSKLVQACAEQGTAYCDLAGETPWMRRMIDAWQETAQDRGARIVHCCGFDSIPSDLGVQFLQELAIERHGEPIKQIRMRVRALKGTASGGTIASMLGIVEEARRDRHVARTLFHPYSLNPEGMREGPDQPDQRDAVFDEGLQSWTAPFVMGSINSRVVRRSHALADFPYGRDFRYDEASLTGPGLKGYWRAKTAALGLGAFATLAAIGPTRSALKRFVLPAPGEGPNAAARTNGYYKLWFCGEGADGEEMQAEVVGDRDPGYGSTSRMLGEAAVCLARDEIPVSGGFWTPATAMGPLLRKRLTQSAGITFDLR